MKNSYFYLPIATSPCLFGCLTREAEGHWEGRLERRRRETRHPAKSHKRKVGLGGKDLGLQTWKFSEILVSGDYAERNT